MARKRLLTVFSLVLVALLGAACAAQGLGEGGAGTTQVAPQPGFAVGGPAEIANGRSAAVAADAKGSAGSAAPQTVPTPLALDPDRAMIVTAAMALRSADPWETSDRAQAVALALGGDVIGLSQSGERERRSATLTLRVPADRFGEALRQLRAIDAEVLTSSVDAKDVTDQFVDLQARLRAKQAEEQRYLALLAKAEKIDDILKLDATLAQVRTQIEQLTGQVNSIAVRTKFSTISVNITTAPAAVPPAPPVAWDPARTAALALAALATLFRTVADAAIWLLILGWVPALVAAVLWLAFRARRGTPAAAV